LQLNSVLLVFLAALLHAQRNLNTKTSTRKTVFVFLYELVGFTLLLPPALFFLYRLGMPTSIGLSIALLSGAIHALYWITHSQAYEGGDLSHVYPIMRSSPALVLILAVVFLGERFTWQGALGTGLITFGAFSIGLKGLAPKYWLEPFSALFREAPTRLAFMTLALTALYSIVDKWGVGHMHPVLFLFCFEGFGFLFLSIYLWVKYSPSDLREEWNGNGKNVILNGALAMASYGLVLWVMQTEKVSHVVGLRQSSVLFAAILGIVVLKEKRAAIRVTASILITVGCLLLSF
jgi:uncharacterized membrane protein